MSATTSPPAPTEKAASKGNAPTKKAATPRKAATAKGTKGAKATEKAPPRFAPNLVEAVRYARHDLHGKRPNLPDGKRPPAASVGDHAAVREAMTKMIDGPTTAEKVLALTGVKSVAALERVARFDPASADDLAALRPLGQKVAPKGTKNAAWRQGRYLAGIVAAWLAEMKVAAKS